MKHVMTRILGIVLLPCALSSSPLGAQTAEANVMAVVNRLFDGMRARDGGIVRAAFRTGAVLVSLRGDTVQTSSPDGFASAVGRAQDEQWNEPIWDTEVRIDGNLATVWTRYAFFRGPNGDQFSHCGFDALILHRGDDGWKISALTDTRQTANCEMPPGH